LTVFAEEPDYRHPCLLRSPRAANLRDELATLDVIELRSVAGQDQGYRIGEYQSAL
jgi:hypothetical protein